MGVDVVVGRHLQGDYRTATETKGTHIMTRQANAWLAAGVVNMRVLGSYFSVERDSSWATKTPTTYVCPARVRRRVVEFDETG